MTPPSDLLRRALHANQLFSATSGAILLLAAGFLAPSFGLEGGTLLRAVGATLLLFAGHLAQATRHPVRPLEIRYFIASDLVWVLATIAILLGAAGPVPMVGKVALGLLAIPVGTFAVLQAKGLGQVLASREVPTSQAPAAEPRA